MNIFSALEHEHGSRDVTRQNDDPPAPPVSLVEGAESPFLPGQSADGQPRQLLAARPTTCGARADVRDPSTGHSINLQSPSSPIPRPPPPFACPVPAITGEARLRSNLSPAAQEEHQAPLLLMPRSIDFHELQAVGWRT